MSRRALNPKQHNIAVGPQGQRWNDGLIKADERWADQTERSLGREYLTDVEAQGRGESTHYYPGQGGSGTQSQGKLFHDPKPTDPHRWPRGFTPERQSDVAVTFPTGRNPYSERVGNLGRGVIARSDMPERDLRHLSKGYEEDGVTLNHLPSGVEARGRQGDFWNPELAKARPYDAPEGQGVHGAIRLGKDVSAHTVMHEVGHAVSYMRRNHRQDALGVQHQEHHPGTSGAEEARADIYANDNTRKRSGERHIDTEDYNGTAGYGFVGDARSEFDSHYMREHINQGKERPSEIGRRLRDENGAASLAELKQHNARSNALLFRRNGKDSEDPTPDHGQYGWKDYSGDVEIGGIPVSGGVPESARQGVRDFEAEKERRRLENRPSWLK